MINFTEIITDAFNRKCIPNTGLSMLDKDMDKVAMAEQIVYKYPESWLVTIDVFTKGMNTIRKGSGMYGKKGKSKFNGAVSKLVLNPAKDLEETVTMLPAIDDFNTVMSKISDFYLVNFLQTSKNILSHPFLTGEGEVDKAKKLYQYLHTSKYKAKNGIFVCCGAIEGFIKGKYKRAYLNTAKFIDYCSDVKINYVLANSIDLHQLNQVVRYGELKGIEVRAICKDAADLLTRSQERTVIIVDGYGIFQKAAYINRLKEQFPNSLIVVTLAKPKNRRDKIVSFTSQVNEFRRDCMYDTEIIPYGNPSEECMIAVKEKDLGTYVLYQSLGG